MTPLQQGSRTAARTFLLALGYFALFRGALFLFDYVGIHLMPPVAPCRQQWEPFGAGHNFWNGFFRWDGGWYRSIILNGYVFRPQGASSTAFYPLFPYLSKWLGAVVGSPFVAGLIISNVATVGGLYYLLELGGRFFEDAIVERAVVLLLVFPTSFFQSCFYTEGIFFCMAAASMSHFYRDRYVTAGVFGGLSMLSRSWGLVLFAALAGELAWRLLRRQTRFRPSMLGLALIPAGFGVFMLVLHYTVGDAMAFFKAMSNWGRVRSLPWATLVDAFGSRTLLLPEQFAATQRVLDAVAAVGFLGIGGTMLWQGFPLAMCLFVLGGVLLPLSTYNLDSMGRYTLSLFPAFFWLGKVSVHHPRVDRLLMFGFAFFLAIYSLRFMRCGWAG